MDDEAAKLPRVGEVIAGKYAIVRALGRGGMGVVYEGMHQRLGQRVAIKMLLGHVRGIPEAYARFDREARAAAKLRGPHVARVIDVDALNDGTPYLVMEYLEGRDLGSEIEERGHLPVGETVDYVLQACMAMAEAHALGIVHRDLKPENMFLCEGEPRLIKVLDFGISKLISEDEKNVTMTRSTLGTPSYMSPEQIRSAKNVDARTDVWSLGVILYEVLTGAPPFSGESASSVIASITADDPQPPLELLPSLPPPLSEAIMRCLRKRPDQRFADVTALAEALQPYAGSVRFEAPSMRVPVARPSSPSTPEEADTLQVTASSARTDQLVHVAGRSVPTESSWTGDTASRLAAATTRRQRLAVLAVVIAGLVLGGLAIRFLQPSPTEVTAASAAPVVSIATPAAAAPHPGPTVTVWPTAAPSASAERPPEPSARPLTVKPRVPAPSASVPPRAPPSGVKIGPDGRPLNL